ncbi:2-succinylbenzoate--CoA ligase [Acidipropionibacterium jensenii]|uniref:2-succinylbenzoate--CoA ligase n=1 Tax=Acidipropionibacterium jensenii TaxID=1749 RepID=A0A448NWT9_9ACTN|nr:AMP-binding protein [Acidipropionibacterium jensenii]QCV89125.1 O-succinylbenzoic acid--CoA ligase [Acidipropionibacterium jensenii]VEI02411.1 2-succinylbenzoate--CoA ligase [Acidipropionibacterium jensenii]
MVNLLSNARVVRVERTVEDVSWLMGRLTAVLDGTTRSVLVPVGGDEMPPAVVTDLETRAARDLDDVRLIVRTSGSTTGHGRLVGLSAAQLTASIGATDDRIGGPGTWVLALPPHHIAGLQVVARSVLAGTTPQVLTGSFDPESLAAGVDHALSRDPHGRVHVSLVPTQLVDALASPRCLEALAQCTSVLVGGAAAGPELLSRARQAGIGVRVTYGMSETCGGCVYDGLPLEGVRVEIDQEHRVRLGGPMVMSGYLDADLGIGERDGTRWLTTSDLGHLDAGALVIDGRADDVIVTGGLKVNASEVAQAVRDTGMVSRAAVLGLDDERWGQLVTAVVVPSPSWTSAPQLREAVASRLPRSHAPRMVVTAEDVPMLASGKVDRIGLRELAERARDEGRAWSRD